MKIPKYIEMALNRRTKAAWAFLQADNVISKYIETHGLDDAIDTADFRGGVESIVNPDDSADRIRQAIENA